MFNYVTWWGKKFVPADVFHYRERNKQTATKTHPHKTCAKNIVLLSQDLVPTEERNFEYTLETFITTAETTC